MKPRSASERAGGYIVHQVELTFCFDENRADDARPKAKAAAQTVGDG